jgi:serine/threonine protein kinase
MTARQVSSEVPSKGGRRLMASKTTAFETTFETYILRELRGEGGAGRVHVATNSAGAQVALKCLAPERITKDRVKRFANEMRFCQKCDHPNVIRVLDTGWVALKDTKCPFYVMKLYGGTLRTLMGGLQANEVLPVFSQILDGVEAAHLMGVWHRDLKPENVLCDEHGGSVAVADFGIAHFEEEELYTVVETKPTDRLANFQYSAPEQRVRGEKVDQRSDIFALGLILNEMFTGEVLQGAGHKKIGDVSGSHAYLDELVEQMTQQSSEKRPESIDSVKKELIGRANLFVAQQRYEESTKQVVNVSEPPAFDPIRLVGFDYKGGVLTLRFSRPVPTGWPEAFMNPNGGNYSSVMGYGPEKFKLDGDTAWIRVGSSADLVQKVLDHAKSYTNAANKGYTQGVEQHLKRLEEKQRAALQKQTAEEKTRMEILAKVQL